MVFRVFKTDLKLQLERAALKTRWQQKKKGGGLSRFESVEDGPSGKYFQKLRRVRRKRKPSFLKMRRLQAFTGRGACP